MAGPSELWTRGGVDDTRLEAKAKDTKKKCEAKDSPSEDRPSRGQGQVCSKSRSKDTDASVLQKEKKGLQKFFFWKFPIAGHKKGLRKFSARFPMFSNKISTVQKKCCP